MSARLVVTDGSLEGRTFALHSEIVTIGRHYSNRVRLREPSVSRHHCRLLQQSGGGYRLEDDKSLLGTLVNGVKVETRDLNHGDHLTIGETTLVFLDRPVEEDHDRSESGVFLTDDSSSSSGAIKVDQTALIRADRLAGGTRIAVSLNILTTLARRVAQERTLDGLGRDLIEHVFEALPADKSGILVLDEYGSLESLVALDRDRREISLEVARSLIDEVVSSGTPMASDGRHTVSGRRANDLGSGPFSFLCLPLANADAVMGALYIECQATGCGFDADHVELAMAMGGVVAGSLDTVRHIEWLEAERRRLQDGDARRGMIGDCAAMETLFSLIARVANTDSTVLLLGESGTGKELAAQAIHRSSDRSSEPFVAVNCATLTRELLESELFGHERGAFTDAVQRKLGKIEVARGGTLFLDEIGEMPASIQPKLLRVLQEREFERVGGVKSIRTECRIVAATNRDLEKLVREHRFREDLYFRLNVISMTLPPLRERGSDILLLASHFAASLCQKMHRPPMTLSRDAVRCLERYAWPGNVRELSNAIERAVVLGESSEIAVEDLPESVVEAMPAGELRPSGYHDAVNQFKARHLARALEDSQGNVTKAARQLGLHPNYLHRLITKLGLRQQ